MWMFHSLNGQSPRNFLRFNWKSNAKHPMGGAIFKTFWGLSKTARYTFLYARGDLDKKAHGFGVHVGVLLP